MFLKYLRQYTTQYRWYFWSGFFALFITDCLDVIPPLIMMRGVDQITSHAPSSELLKTALLFATLTVALAFIRYHWRMQFGKYHQNLARDLREKIFKKLTEMTPGFYAKNPTGELMSLLTNDVEAIRMGMGPGMVVLSDSLFYFLTIPPIMLSLSVSLTFKSLILLPLLPFFVSWLGKKINKYFILEQEKFSELSGLVQENISGIRTVKSFVQEKNQSRVFNKASFDLRKATEKVAFAETFMHPVMEFCVSAGVVVLIFLGTDEVAKGAITIGTFVAFHRYISKMVWPMTAIGWGFSLVSQAAASLKRVDDFLNTPADVVEPTNAKNFSNGEIKFNHLSFNYSDHPHSVLKDVSFEIKPGETMGIIGSVGSGKSTLAHLLCHLYPLKKNQIFINNIDITEISLHDLRKNITLLPQEPFLFSQTIKENINYGLNFNADFDLIENMAKTACIDNEIKKLPAGYETYLGERGINLSGGQKQRLAMARGLARQTPIIIFDDSLSAVDGETEKQILKNIFDQTGSKQTVVIISHKVTSLNRCDRLAAFENGQLEFVGTPQEMKLKSKVYKELLEHQNEVSN